MRLAPLTLVCVLACAAACGSRESGGPQASAANINLNGAGATFPYPLYSKWVAEYERRDPRVRINYQSIGSGGGIRQITERTVDFGASDAPMTPEQLARAPGKLVHIPMTLGAVVVTYNLPNAPASLKLGPEAVTGIFLGEITKWDDPRLAALNPGVTLPAQTITVVHRTDGSGTTAVFTDYLAKVSPAWKEKVGTGTSVRWPAGVGGKGNEGVAGTVKTTPGALGYVELAYAIQTKLPYAHLRNRAGQFVEPAIPSITAAAAGHVVRAIAPAREADELAVSITDPAGEQAYPIAAFTYVLVYQDAPDRAKGEALAQFFWWAIHDGQALAPALHYAPLPPAVVTKVEARLKSLTAGGQPLLP
ncbi:MAG TPA: phosphate ABC transporter substrate-binding protein PstS [Polyangia bacterium]|jgi:phosphate transport system substrate-binding protein